MSKTFEMTITEPPETLFARVRRLAQDAGVAFTGNTDSGTFSGKGVAGSYRRWDKQLSITIDKKPMIASWGLVEDKIRGFFTSA